MHLQRIVLLLRFERFLCLESQSNRALARASLELLLSEYMASKVTPYRTDKAVRGTTSEDLIIPLLDLEARVNIGADTWRDLLRGIRSTIYLTDVFDPKVETCCQFTV